MKTDLFQSCGHCWVFQICWHIVCTAFTASYFRIWSSSTGIWLWRPVGFDYRTYTGLGKQTLGGHKQNLACTRTQGKGAVTPQETARLACECPGVPGGGMGWKWHAAGSGALSVAVCAWELLKEVAIIFITSTIVWSQVKQQGGSIAHFQQKIGLKIYWAWPPIRTRPSFPHSQSLPSGSFHKPLTSIHQRETEWKPQSQKNNQTDHMDHSLV